ncbi:MAG TPA: ribonuclease III [Candidatus Baltobacteraceae bacterium]|jgi:ribonuclease-3
MSGEQHRRRLRALLRLAGVRSAGDLELIDSAFTHESYAKERGGTSNERLEFYGDSVLGHIVAGWLFECFPDEPEGRLTVRKASIVNDARLAESARRLGFPEIVRLGAGMRTAGGTDNTSILADAFEAFVAALCISYGLERARKFVIAEHVEQHDHDASTVLDAKTRLQHYAQAHLSATPVYRETSRGTPQRPAFNSRVTVKGKTLGTGSGPSKKAAQQAAAEAALSKLQAAM